MFSDPGWGTLQASLATPFSSQPREAKLGEKIRVGRGMVHKGSAQMTSAIYARADQGQTV